MGTAGIGLALAPPGGPLQMEPLVGDWVDQDAEQAPAGAYLPKGASPPHRSVSPAIQ